MKKSVAYNAIVDKLDDLVLGSSSFTAGGWEKTFYPPGLKKASYLGYYAERFKSVEVDSTFYGIPSDKTVLGWYEQTPDDFVFACKVPQSITHESCLIDCDDELRGFLNAMSLLEGKLGPLLFQFPYFDRKVFPTPDEFFDRLRAFLPKLPEDFRFALEIRNKAWVGPELLDLLRKHRVAFTLIDHPWMSRPAELMDRCDVVTSNFTYVRLLGDRYAIEKLTQTWDRVVVNRDRELAEWGTAVDALLSRDIKVYTYVNNHFAGHSPETLRQFLEMLRQRQNHRT
jgi:uncharacterized protein YecE (DUF72 family)